MIYAGNKKYRLKINFIVFCKSEEFLELRLKLLVPIIRKFNRN